MLLAATDAALTLRPVQMEFTKMREREKMGKNENISRQTKFVTITTKKKISRKICLDIQYMCV